MYMRVLDNCYSQVKTPIQTRLCSDNVPIKSAIDRGSRSAIVMRKKDNFLK